jgi:hypothetical protein
MFDWLACLSIEHFDPRQSACGFEMAQTPGVPTGYEQKVPWQVCAKVFKCDEGRALLIVVCRPLTITNAGVPKEVSLTQLHSHVHCNCSLVNLRLTGRRYVQSEQ